MSTTLLLAVPSPPPTNFSFLSPALEVQSIATVVKFPSFPTVFEVYHSILSKIFGLYSSLVLIFFPQKLSLKIEIFFTTVNLLILWSNLVGN